MSAVVSTRSPGPHDKLASIIKAGVRIAVLLHVSRGLRHRERYSIGVKHNFDTAAWAFLPPHRIWLGSRMLERARSGLTVAQRELYAACYVRHEFGHMAFTTKDLKSVLAAGAETIPHRLLNIFEDARMEQCERAATGEQFHWLRYEEPFKVSSPSSLLLAMVQNEAPMRAPSGPDPAAPVWEVADEVADFYVEARSAPSTEALVPIIERWKKRFEEPDEDVAPSRDALSILLTASEAAEFGQKMDVDTEDLEGEHKIVPVAVESVGKGDLLLPEGSLNELMAPLLERAAATAASLSRLFMKPAGWASSETPSRRIDIRSGPMLGQTTWKFRHKELPRIRPYDVGVVFDCSGSMGGEPLREGLVLLEALSHLARNGVARGWVVLSAVCSRSAYHQRFKLPLDHCVLERVWAPGDAEGLQTALLAHADELRQMSQVLVYTDAAICDRPLDRAALKRRGISPIGLYVGLESSATQMPRYFAEYLVRPTVELLVEAMVARFKVRQH